jgi:hypothetical protein
VDDSQEPEFDASDPDLGPIESFLTRHLRANPGLGFGAIVRAASSECGISRTTAARYLALLVRYGEVSLSPDRRYYAQGADVPMARPVVESRWYGETYTIFPDGSAIQVMEQEFRVTAGRIEHLELSYPRAPREFDWWSTLAAKASRVPASRDPNRLYTVRLDLAQPLGARDPQWHRLRASAELPHWCRTAQGPLHSRGAFAKPEVVTNASAAVSTPSQSARFGERYTPDGRIRLEVNFPEGYPVGASRLHVRYELESQKIDPVEEKRLRALQEDPWRQEGFHRVGSKLILSVPSPILDRTYEIEWELPTVAAWNRWRESQGRRWKTLAPGRA